MKTHPVADLFPMMGEDELAALAEDIKANGLKHPIVRDEEGRIVDGRNRFKACELVDVEPQFIETNGDDPLGLVVSLNIKRRNLTAGQRAAAAAEASKMDDLGVNKAAKLFGSSNGYVQHARSLDDDLRGQVKRGVLPLADARKKQQARDKENEEREAEAEALRRLESENADLVEAVDAGHMSFAEATEELKKRERRAKLPADLLKQVEDGMSLDEAEAVVIEREERLVKWAENVERSVSVLSGLAGHPLPAGLKEKLESETQKTLALLLKGVPKEKK